MTLQEWVAENCTESDKEEFLESVKRQEAMFNAMLESGEIMHDSDTGKIIFTEKHKGHSDDAVWASFQHRYAEATGQA